MIELLSSHKYNTSDEESYFMRPTLSNSAVVKSPSKLLWAALPATFSTTDDCISTSRPLKNFSIPSKPTKMPALPP